MLESDSDRVLFEAMLKTVYQAVGCDAVQDISRVLRLPGFWNVKSIRNGELPMPCKIITCDPKKTFSFATFSSWWKYAQKVITARTDPLDSIAQKERKPICSDTEKLLFELDRKVRDRSKRDYAIILKLLESGLSSDEIWSLVSDKSKFKERGREYFNMTIRNAMRELESTK